MAMLENDEKVQELCSKHQTKNLREFANFVALIYTPWWLTCSEKSSAPNNDLTLIKKLYDYKIINEVISECGVKAVKRHLWYLSSEIAFIAIFDKNVDVTQKILMSEKLKKCKPEEPLKKPTSRYGLGYGKPAFPGNLKSHLKLYSFPQITQISIVFFSLF